MLDEAPTYHMGETLYDALHVGRAYREIYTGGFDIVHDHSGFLGPAFAGMLPVPVVHTLHGPFTPEIRRFYEAFKDDCYYVAISRRQLESCPGLNYLGMVPNAVDVDEHRYLGEKGDYLICVGRICEAKGTEQAVLLARETGNRLLLAGKIDPGRDRDYFESRVVPHLDGKMILYLGEVSQEEKVRLVSRARALLFTVQWEEPFGLVMAEALACGTPVLATRWGAVPEVVEHGVTGFLADSPRELASYVERIDELDPLDCRRAAEEHFSPGAMAASYLDIYHYASDMHPTRLWPHRAHTA
jgi:glycosyltransferase involved in cell wall biosynthesis